MAKGGNRRPSSAELLAQVNKGEIEEAIGQAAAPSEEVGKVDMPDNVERCDDCQSAFLQRIPGGKRCGNCGKQFRVQNGRIVTGPAVPPAVYEGVVRK